MLGGVVEVDLQSLQSAGCRHHNPETTSSRKTYLHKYAQIRPYLRQLLRLFALFLFLLLFPVRNSRRTVCRTGHILRQHLLQYFSRSHVRLGKRRPDPLHNRSGKVIGFPQGGDGAQGAEGEACIEGVDGLADEVEVVDDDWEDMSVRVAWEEGVCSIVVI